MNLIFPPPQPHHFLLLLFPVMGRAFDLFNGRFHFYVIHLDGGNGELTFGNVFRHPFDVSSLTPVNKLTVILMGIRNTRKTSSAR